MFKEKPVFAKHDDGSLPFSQSVRIGNILYLSGQVLKPDKKEEYEFHYYVQIGFESKGELADGFENLGE